MWFDAVITATLREFIFYVVRFVFYSSLLLFVDEADAILHKRNQVRILLVTEKTAHQLN